jgi:hypothetical protein
MSGGWGIDAGGKKRRHTSGVFIESFSKNELQGDGALTSFYERPILNSPAPQWHRALDDHGQPLDDEWRKVENEALNPFVGV